jgi:hypothetical protein
MFDRLRDLAEALTGRDLALGVAVTIVGLLATLALATYIVVNLPVDHFKDPRHHRTTIERHWALHLAGRIAKNVAGALLVIIGVVLSIPAVPGQGILTILVGLTLLQFPGKRRLELAIVRHDRVLRVLNKLRSTWNRPPLET